MKQRLIYFLLFLTTLTISVWFQNCSVFLSSHDQADDSGSSLSISHPDPTPSPNKTSIGITLIDRLGVTSTLENVFLSDQSSASDRGAFMNLVNAEIRPQQHAYGRPCDILAQGTYAECFFNLANLEKGMWQSTSTVRESSRLQLCRRLVANDALLSSAVNQIKGQDLTPNMTSLQNSVQLFYPAWESQAITPVVQSLIELDYQMAANSETIINRWRLIILSLCETAYWEIL